MLPAFDSIFEAQRIGEHQKRYIMAHFGRLLVEQGNEWRCFVMLFGKSTTGKTKLVDLFVSFFEEQDRWQMDGHMDPRWVGSYVAKRQLLYYRDASARSTTLTCNQVRPHHRPLTVNLTPHLTTPAPTAAAAIGWKRGDHIRVQVPERSYRIPCRPVPPVKMR